MSLLYHHCIHSKLWLWLCKRLQCFSHFDSISEEQNTDWLPLAYIAVVAAVLPFSTIFRYDGIYYWLWVWEYRKVMYDDMAKIKLIYRKVYGFERFNFHFLWKSTHTHRHIQKKDQTEKRNTFFIPKNQNHRF